MKGWGARLIGARIIVAVLPLFLQIFLFSGELIAQTDKRTAHDDIVTLSEGPPKVDWWKEDSKPPASSAGKNDSAKPPEKSIGAGFVSLSAILGALLVFICSYIAVKIWKNTKGKIVLRSILLAFLMISYVVTNELIKEIIVQSALRSIFGS